METSRDGSQKPTPDQFFNADGQALTAAERLEAFFNAGGQIDQTGFDPETDDPISDPELIAFAAGDTDHLQLLAHTARSRAHLEADPTDDDARVALQEAKVALYTYQCEKGIIT